MKNDISALTSRFVVAAELSHAYLIAKRLGESLKHRDRAEELHRTIIARGADGIEAMLEVADGTNFPAAILSCALTHRLSPKRCAKNLKRIMKRGGPAYSMAARGVMEMLDAIRRGGAGMRDRGDGCYSVSFGIEELTRR